MSPTSLPNRICKITHKPLAHLQLRQHMKEVRIPIILLQNTLHTLPLKLMLKHKRIIIQRILIRRRHIHRR